MSFVARGVTCCHSGILHLCVTSIFKFKICLMLEAGTPAASFIKFTTNLLSAAIKDAVFVEGNGHSSDKVPLGKRKAHSSAPTVRPTQNRPASQPGGPPLPCRGGRNRARQMALAPQFPAAFPGPDSDQAEGEGKREGAACIGRSDAPSKTDRENGRRRPPAAARSLPPFFRPTVRPSALCLWLVLTRRF